MPALRYGAQDQDPARPTGVPCLTCHGFYAATTDPHRIAAMLAAVPHGLLAIRTGAPSGLVVIDVDTGHGGMATLCSLSTMYFSILRSCHPRHSRSPFHSRLQTVFREPGRDTSRRRCPLTSSTSTSLTGIRSTWTFSRARRTALTSLGNFSMPPGNRRPRVGAPTKR
ncbi:bifunctional DNA primase/polymerase [Catellatospora sichuanensis]|uniref:bifunctional DNA primase/polymerase n=1 Tax=Catellatospora sichuanensis TaxID=1969805 RepID=UPI001FE6B6C7|nr:bifunctional DNA primase/polymerase [Catellatospora sichuanensis]